MTDVIEQRTDEWFAARLGKVTASRIADVTAKTKTGYSASRDAYAWQLVVERLTKKPAESFSNSAMQWGTETEPQARIAYMIATDTMVDEIAFVTHPTIEQAGASPDGLVSVDGLVEIKCPNTNTHLETYLSKKISKKYIDQMQWQMRCTQRQWCDFVSYDPRLPDHLQLVIIRVNYDADYVQQLESEVISFLHEVAEKFSNLISKGNKNES